MTQYRIFLISQILFIATSLAVPTNVEETEAWTAASSPVPSDIPASSALPEGISESAVAAAVKLLKKGTEVKESIIIGDGTMPAEEGDGIPNDVWVYENTTYVDTRRILYSKTVEKGKRPYMVYLELTKESAKAHKYRGWLCGGVIVDKYYVLTSAACVEDADRFFIVSGTTKFVDSFDYKIDECVCKHRRKVIWKCIPKNYKFDFQDSIKWSSNDIAIVKVDRPFKLGVLEKGCEFATDLISLNNVSRELEKSGTKGFIAGWGSGNNFREGVYRRQSDIVQIPKNAKFLQEAKVCIMDNEQCQKRWAQRFREIIKNYMICTKDVIKRLSELCEKKYANCTDVEIENARRSAEQVEEPTNELATWSVDLGRHLRDPDDYTARRASIHGGFCENDHGGPLIVKYQGKERVIGVISACKIDPKSHNCHGPFLYTSVFKNRQFIQCAINKDIEENCRRVFRTGITHEEWQVSWDGFKEDDELDTNADSDEIDVTKSSSHQNKDDVVNKEEDDSNLAETEIRRKETPVEIKEPKYEEKEEKEKVIPKTEKRERNRKRKHMKQNKYDTVNKEEEDFNLAETEIRRKETLVEIKEPKYGEKEEKEKVNPKTEKREKNRKRKHMKQNKYVAVNKEEDDSSLAETKIRRKETVEIKDPKYEETEEEVNPKTEKREKNRKRKHIKNKKKSKRQQKKVEKNKEVAVEAVDEIEDEPEVKRKQEEPESEDKAEVKKKQVESEAEDEVEMEVESDVDAKLRKKQVEEEAEDAVGNKKYEVKKEAEDYTIVEGKQKQYKYSEDNIEVKTKEVESEDESEEETKAEIETEEEAVMDVAKKTKAIEDKNESMTDNKEDKAEVFYESSREENVNDPVETD